MCGFAGIVNLSGCDEAQRTTIHKMAEELRHRGPNDEGYVLFSQDQTHVLHGNETSHVDSRTPSDPAPAHVTDATEILSHIALAHRRLSIIDLSFQGHQPMCYANRYWIVYNGEIYNHVELRIELESEGYRFKSETDTELIPAAYERWGPDCLNKFNGMWAFVLYDRKQNKLFISRDRFGIKPLYYFLNDQVFVFASEVKSILRCDAVHTSPNLDYCRLYLQRGPLEHIRETAFTSINRFPVASYSEFQLEQLPITGLQTRRFWSVNPNLSDEPISEIQAAEYANTYYDLLKDSVRLRLRADVRIGAALSGGLDSSSITYLINEVLRENGNREKLQTFSSVYKTEGTRQCDESGYVDELARFLDVKSNQIEPQVADVRREHRNLVYAFDNPPSGLNMGGWYTFKCVGRSDVVINLDGQGADEQLGGYFKYIWRYLSHLPLSRLCNEFIAFSRIDEIQHSKLIGSLLLNILLRLLPRSLVKRLLSIGGRDRAERFIQTVNEELHQDRNEGLVALIHFGDSQSMAHSVESRLPFMDYRLVEFLAAVPASYKIHNGWTKYLARLAFDSKLPDSITWRKDKMGWPDPSEYWMRGPLKEWLCSEVESSPFLRTLGVGHDIRKRIEGSEPIEGFIRMLNLAVWADIFFGVTKTGQTER